MRFFSYFYGIFTIIGGLIGYVAAASVASLIAGLACGVGIVMCTLVNQAGSPWGRFGLYVLSLALGLWFLNGYLETGKIMPAGVMTILSTIHLVGLMLSAKTPAQAAR